ncbi:SMI1/KNR4 family protein [Shewanella halotolerans]|uniref:SMI1/KNR4 family protein n=1 Tax=Shewanella halotolerans TaxID=2864204 RepID=UPI001C65E19A|nr:SMI1/KNR4 family protein [Shewanella halotolerans]QYJ89378.1 SMI1/KNR4 family protein [Shewanella halotolerans]
MKATLPKEYIEFFKSSDQLWGETDYEFGGYFELEPLDKIEQMNNDIGIAQDAPGFIAFACDGGGEVFVFDESGQIFLLPLIGMEPSVAVKLASSWSEFETHIVQNA